MSASRYVVGIDLGTTNSALAYVDTGRGQDQVTVLHLPVPQVVNPGAAVTAALRAENGPLYCKPISPDITSGADWVEGYVRALAFVRGLAIGLGVIFVLATTLIVSNTIRLAVLSRRDELEILSLVGASRSFVNTPFLIEGLLQGAAAGALAWLLLYALFRSGLPFLSDPIQFLIGRAVPTFFGPLGVLALIGIGVALGLLSAVVSLLRVEET